MIHYMTEPLSEDEVVIMADENGVVHGNILVDLNDIIDGSFESFLDLLSTKLVGCELLTDICYSIVGHTVYEIIFKVEGDANELIAEIESREG